MSAFAELVAASHFSFLRGASSGQDLVQTAIGLGHTGLGIADRNTLSGVVRAYGALEELREDGLITSGPSAISHPSAPFTLLPETSDDDRPRGRLAYVERKKVIYGPPENSVLQTRIQEQARAFKLVVGARLVFADGTPDIVIYPQNRKGWARLCRLLTLGNRRTQKGQCELYLADLVSDTNDLLLIVMPPSNRAGLSHLLNTLREAAPSGLWVAASMPRRGTDRRKLAELKRIGVEARVPLIASNDVLYADQSARDLQDILSCIREGRRIENAGRRLEVNAERHLKAGTEMARLFGDCPQAVGETQEFLARANFRLDELKYEYPEEPIPAGHSPQAWLETLTWRSASKRYSQGIPEKVENLLHLELALIKKLDYARYFLTIHDIVQVAESKGILAQGRGSAANSAVCYVLGITCVDPAEHDLLFARFISEERREPPDIDIDFEHERREEIIQHIYERYGRERAGIAATVIRYRPKSAIREAGKVLGLSEDTTAALSATQWGSWGSEITANQVRQAGLDPDNPQIARAVYFAKRMLGIPRHLSQHVGGFILTKGRLDELVPIGNAAMEDRTYIEWDKVDIETLKLMKVDLLALGMLTCIRKAFDYLEMLDHKPYTLAGVPHEQPVYDMLSRGDSIGVFQVESRAQINMLPRMRPKVFYDLVIEVAIIRPGPIQGNMVHPYLKRRANPSSVKFPSPAKPHNQNELRDILGKTLGVPLFQEQAMAIAMIAAEFSDVEANKLRRAMATFKHVGTIHLFETRMVERMVERGYEREFAQNCFEQIKGFGSYGFPESHAASFAKLVYISAWIKYKNPTVFACALLNSQPMGFYAPAQIVRDAREHGVEVLAPDINYSLWDNTLERKDQGDIALRLGFRQVEGMHEAEALRLISARTVIFDSVEMLSIRAKLHGRPMKALADVDAFRSIGLDRRAALWAVRRLPDDIPLPLFQAADARELAEEEDAALPAMSLGEHVATDYQTLRLSLKGHPMEILRPVFSNEGVLSCRDAAARRDGARVMVAGVVLVRQRPGKGNAIFITLEDETGITNVVLWARQFEFFRREVMGARLMLVTGKIQKSPEGVVHLMAASVQDRTMELQRMMDDKFKVRPQHMKEHPRNVKVLPGSRDFH